MAARAVGVTEEEILRVGLGVLEGMARYVELSQERRSSPREDAVSLQGMVEEGVPHFARIMCAPQIEEIIRRYLRGVFDERLRAEREGEAWLRRQLAREGS
jgi:hypothetical protein